MRGEGAPGFGDNRKSNLQDIAILTGGVVISEDLGYKLEQVDVSMLGTAKKVTVSKDDTIILDGAGEKTAIEERCEQLRDAIVFRRRLTTTATRCRSASRS